MKVFFRRVHLYLALAAGLVITVTCLTGAVLVFEEELQHALHPTRYFSPVAGEVLPADSIVALVQRQLPGMTVTGFRRYSAPRRNIEVSVRDTGKSGGAAAGKGGEGGKKAFVDPATGRVRELYEYSASGFYTVFALHRWLLAGDSGKLIVGCSTLIFLFILITGVILWWPRNRRMLRQRLQPRWSAGWKRLTHDFHVVLGFYSAIFLFIFAFTGLAWSFKWFNEGIYTVTGTSSRPAPLPRSRPGGADVVPLQAVLQGVMSAGPGARWYNVALPKDDSAPLTITLLPASAAHEGQTTAYHFDQYSGRLLKRVRFADRNQGQRVRATFKPVHTGSIGGVAGKIIALLACLLGGFFPITGYIMWANRAWRKRR